MKESCKSKLIQITLALIALLMFSQPALGGDPSEEVDVLFKGKIFGDQLMLLDNMGRKSIAKDGIYTTEDGTKITVENGAMIDIPTSFSKGAYSSIRIVEVEYAETN